MIRINALRLSHLLFPAIWLGILLTLSGCFSAPQPVETQTPSPVPATSTATPVPTATPTPAPLAARVNGDGILLSEYQAETKRYADAAKAMGTEAAPAVQRDKVLNDLVDQTLLAQTAVQNGFKMDDAALQARLDALISAAGGENAFKDWLNRNYYTLPDFRAALRRSAAAAFQRDSIIATVPETMEQIQARQILVQDAAEMDRLQKQVQSGTDLATIAYRYDPVTGGDLGWFPRGYLTQPEVETAAFALQPGQISKVVQTKFGYHLIQVIKREAQRPLSPEARRALQHKALQAWLTERRSKSQIDILAP